jgi:hypothetical protein
MKHFATFLLIVTALSSAGAERPQRCGDVVDRELSAANTWMALAEWYHEHPHCVDGFMAEHVTSSIGDWLSQERPAFLRLHVAVAKHGEFELLVNWHLGGEYHSVETLRLIARNADRKCPTIAASVCQNIRQTVLSNLAGRNSKTRVPRTGG